MPKMQTKCPDCGKWNCIKEGVPDTMSTDVVPLFEVEMNTAVKISTGMDELDAVLTGGTVIGQAVLIGGEPGAGKSTLLLEVADAMTKKKALDEVGQTTKKKNRCLYVTTEEEIGSLRARSIRLSCGDQVLVCHNKEIALIESDLAEWQPEFCIIDSLSMMSGCFGSTNTQVDTLKRVVEVCKAMMVTLFVVVHITKDGELAGAKALEHIVDTVLILSQDQKNSATRQLRCTKNRHGSEDYIGLFEMTAKGLRPFDAGRMIDGTTMQAGQAFGVTAMGGRSILVEVQALTEECGEKSNRPSTSSATAHHASKCSWLSSAHVQKSM